MNSFDVIVVGAGPAGAAAAEKTTSMGYSTLLLEKKTLPRDKPCAGVLPPRILHLLREIPEDVVERKFKGYHIYSPSGIKVKSEFHKPGFIVDRKKFDYFLVGKARNAGAIVYDNAKVTDVVVRDEVVVKAGVKSFTSQFLVAADGVNSIVKKRLGLSAYGDKDFALGVQYEIKLPRDEVSRRVQDYFEVHYTGVVEEGYGWISPHETSLRLGLGSTSSSFKSNHRKFLDDFMKHEYVRDKVVGGKIVSFTGHQIPLSGPVPEPYHSKVFFVGDAGSFVWPMTGEGVYPGILSGFVAGEAVAKALEGDPEPGKVFNDLLEKKGLLRIRNQVKDRSILENRESMEEYVERLRKLAAH